MKLQVGQGVMITGYDPDDGLPDIVSELHGGASPVYPV